MKEDKQVVGKRGNIDYVTDNSSLAHEVSIVYAHFMCQTRIMSISFLQSRVTNYRFSSSGFKFHRAYANLDFT